MNEAQNNEPMYRALKTRLKTARLPLTNEQHFIFVVTMGDYFILSENDLLYKYHAEKAVLCIPPPMVELVIREAHSLPLVGHLGKTKTVMRIRQHYWWLSLDKDVTDFIHKCHTCKQHKPSTRRIRQRMGRAPIPSDVWQHLHMDVWSAAGKSADGYENVVGFIDVFSKYIVLIPVKRHQATDIVNAIINGVILPYGVPREITSDGAPEFRSALQRQFLKLFGVKHHIVTPYRPQANGQIERIFRTTRSILATTAERHPAQWPRYLAQVAFAYNTAYHETIQNTPFYLMFGRDPTIGLFTLMDNESNLDEHTRDRIQRMKDAREVVRFHLTEMREIYGHYYNQRSYPHTFAVDDLVYLETLVVPRHSIQKIYPRYLGPYRIKAISGPTIGVVPLEKPDDPVRFIHSDRAKRCPHDIVIDGPSRELNLPFLTEVDPNLEEE
jgi:hypothetical protein